jgi:HlyD family secretion protein
MSRKQLLPLALVLAIVAIAVYLTTRRSRPDESSLAASGTVEATDAALAFQAPGRIVEVRVHEGDRVRAGDTVAALDRAELEARRGQSIAALAVARARLAEMEHGARAEEVVQARAADSAATVRARDAERDRDRAATLLAGGAVSQENLDKAQLAFDVARNAAEQAHQQLQLVLAGPRREQVDAQRAALAQATAMLQQAEANFDNAVIRAPFDGVVTVRNREPGETVAAGAPVVTVANLGDRWVRIYVSEVRLGEVRLGEGAVIRTDTYRDRQYRGAVSFIATEAEFTPRNVQTAEERVKLVFAVKVRVVGDSVNDLKPGMPADVTLAPAAAPARP